RAARRVVKAGGVHARARRGRRAAPGQDAPPADGMARHCANLPAPDRQARQMHRRDFIGSAALAALLPLVGGGSAFAASRGRLLPRPLDPGDTVALVSPSSATDERLSLQLAREVMEALGFKVKTGEHYAARYGSLAGTDAQRAGDLNAMFADPSVRGIVCVRGGSGAARLLPVLASDTIRANPKVLLGYSDITALHCGLGAQTGLVTFHGPIGSG